MIVRRDSGLLHLITQPDHAAAARSIMEIWAPLAGAERRDSILLAIGEHDNGWTELDAAPSTDPASGRIFDFMTLPIEQRQAVWPRGVDRLARLDTWAAALVARHAAFVYDRYRDEAGWASFFSAMDRACDELAVRSGRTARELHADYVFVRIGDLISLMFCTGNTNAQAYEGWTVQLVDDCVTVVPDSLGGRRVPIAVPALELADMPYRSDQALQAALASARRVTINGAVSATSVGRH